MSKVAVRVERLDHGAAVVELRGREAWAISELAQAGANGVTPIDRPGPRWSEYVRRLRGRGFNIVTHYERHDGPFPGNHGRYVLTTPVRISQEGVSDA